MSSTRFKWKFYWKKKKKWWHFFFFNFDGWADLWFFGWCVFPFFLPAFYHRIKGEFFLPLLSLLCAWFFECAWCDGFWILFNFFFLLVKGLFNLPPAVFLSWILKFWCKDTLLIKCFFHAFGKRPEEGFERTSNFFLFLFFIDFELDFCCHSLVKQKLLSSCFPIYFSFPFK